MAYVPPWLAINPKDFVQAASEGGALGARLGATATEADLARERLAQSAAQHAASLGSEERLARLRLEQMQREREAARALREWEINQQLAVRESAIQSANERAANSLAEKQRYGENLLNVRQNAIDEREAYHKGVNELHSALNKMRQDRLEAELGRPKIFSRREGIVQVGPEGEVETLYHAPAAVQDELPSVLNDTAVEKPSWWNRITHFFSPSAPAAAPTISGAPPVLSAPVETNNPYKVGARYGDLRYKGGDPASEDSWEPATND